MKWKIPYPLFTSDNNVITAGVLFKGVQIVFVTAPPLKDWYFRDELKKDRS